VFFLEELGEFGEVAGDLAGDGGGAFGGIERGGVGPDGAEEGAGLGAGEVGEAEAVVARVGEVDGGAAFWEKSAKSSKEWPTSMTRRKGGAGSSAGRWAR
jgi:hypothetical protein